MAAKMATKMTAKMPAKKPADILDLKKPAATTPEGIADKKDKPTREGKPTNEDKPDKLAKPEATPARPKVETAAKVTETAQPKPKSQADSHADIARKTRSLTDAIAAAKKASAIGPENKDTETAKSEPGSSTAAVTKRATPEKAATEVKTALHPQQDGQQIAVRKITRWYAGDEKGETTE